MGFQILYHLCASLEIPDFFADLSVLLDDFALGLIKVAECYY